MPRNMSLKNRWLAAGALGVLVACSNADETAAQATTTSNQANSAQAKLTAAANESRLSLAGTVASTTPRTFQLDIGDDMITVEMDDWDWFKEGNALKAGDEVVVTGRVDQDLWEQKKIEANSVYVRNLGVRFYANGADEEDLAVALVQVDPVTSTIGTVTAAEGAEFVVGSATGPVRVDLSKLSVRPVVEVGDRVHAWGELDVDAREKLELMAQGVAVLNQDQTKQSTS